jgi:exosome complex RNA-binding protein Rrp42 (RNase PH superfamily)
VARGEERWRLEGRGWRQFRKVEVEVKVEGECGAVGGVRLEGGGRKRG